MGHTLPQQEKKIITYRKEIIFKNIKYFELSLHNT